ncbi:hypothetical protein F5884DRAFT_151489 [Xylogone sp. PMI_703]|nr:hypothetical protein F5884DRAFT_151489 [Xylogone sp. PMI_703]
MTQDAPGVGVDDSAPRMAHQLKSLDKTGNLVGPTTPAAPCLVTDFIRYQVETNSEAFAVHCEHEQPYTYSELWQLVNQIVAKSTFAPGVIIPVCMDPTVEFVATLLAILVSGSAYVVLDPEGSPERNRVIASDCGNETVIVLEKYASLFDHATSIESILSSEVAPAASRRSASASPSDLAYMIYTSGK